MKISAETKRWMRNRSDELAVAAGCKFDLRRAEFCVDWIHDYCRLYEGEWAGQSLELRDWQYEATMRMFGWIRKSEKWGRWVRRFNKASIWVPKKNKKSPTLAAWALFLLAGDSEPGQKVFLGAKDGKQAREIAGTHAVEMVLSSPELSSECTINKNLMRITHEPSRSYMQPLSSSNSRTQESKEGINGCVLIDETHVVDREFIDRLSRAGISRSEPLQIEVSTAGSNPDGYGRSQYEYGRLVESGEVEDIRFFYLCYEAPQKLTDKELDADPLKYGKIANPAMGHTVDPAEFLDDYTRSKQSLSSLAQFKMYRLNSWQQSESPWLREDDWMKCSGRFTTAEMGSLPAAAGLDLSKTRDMSALNVTWVDDDEFWQKTWLWITEKYAEMHKTKAQFAEWEAAGCLTIIPGDVIRHSWIREQFAELVEQVNLAAVCYDKTYAQEFREWVEEEWPQIELIEFPQSPAIMEKPIDDFEALVIDGKLHHDGNKCMNWQAKHCGIKPNARGHRILVKPKLGDVRKIDGMVASVMGLWGAMNATQEAVWSREDGVLL